MAVLRGDPLRAKRASVDTGTGEKRISDTGRAAHISRGTFVNKQKDLGINSTEGVAQGIRAKDAEFKQGIADRNKPLDEAEGKLNAAQQEVTAGYKTASENLNKLKEWWGWDPNKTGEQARAEHLKVVSRGEPTYGMGGGQTDGQTDESYAAGQAANAKALQDRIAAVKDASYYGDETGSWDPTSSRGSADYKNMPGAGKRALRKMFNEAQGTLKSNEEMLKTAQGSIEAQRGVLQGHRDVVKGYEDLNKKQWADVHAKYEKRGQTMKEILGGMTIG